jgi:hypothetical protein
MRLTALQRVHQFIELFFEFTPLADRSTGPCAVFSCRFGDDRGAFVGSVQDRVQKRISTVMHELLQVIVQSVFILIQETGDVVTNGPCIMRDLEDGSKLARLTEAIFTL